MEIYNYFDESICKCNGNVYELRRVLDDDAIEQMAEYLYTTRGIDYSHTNFAKAKEMIINDYLEHVYYNRKIYYTYSHDAKIMNWLGDNYDVFLSRFTNEDVEAMQDWLSDVSPFPIDRDYFNDMEKTYNYEYKKSMVIDQYIKRWLMQQIDGGITSGADHLYGLIQKFGIN